MLKKHFDIAYVGVGGAMLSNTQNYKNVLEALDIAAKQAAWEAWKHIDAMYTIDRESITRRKFNDWWDNIYIKSINQ